MPFKNTRSLSNLPDDSNEEKILEYLMEADLTVEIKVGTDPQIIPMSLDLWNKYIYIASNSLENGVYDKDKSSTFKTNNEAPIGDLKYFRKGIYCNDTFLFDYSDKKIKNENTQFILVTETEYSNEYRKGLIGLEITSYKQELTLINQLKNKDLINNYYHFMYFTKDDEGFFILGNSPHEYNPKKYSYNDFRQVNARESTQSWELSMTNIKYGEETFDSKSYDLDFKFGMIMVGVAMKNEYYNDFFAKRIRDGLCKESLYNDKYFIYSCIDDENKVKFHELKDFHFYNLDLEYDFVFTYKDLFITFNNRKYFLITYKIGSITVIFGKPFFRKYTMVFNPDNKQIGHYIKESKDDANDINNSYSFTKKIVLIVVIVVLLLILIVLGIVLYKSFLKKKRKNELEEDFVYIPEENNNIGINNK